MKQITNFKDTNRYELIITANVSLQKDALYARYENEVKAAMRYVKEAHYFKHAGDTDADLPRIIQEGADNEVIAWASEEPEWLNLSFAKHACIYIFGDETKLDPEQYDIDALLRAWHTNLKLARAYFVSGGVYDTSNIIHYITDEGEILKV
jgi:hypothetical protein